MRPQCLVAYYSLTGRTRRAARALADALEAEIEEVSAPRAATARPRIPLLGGAALLGLSARIGKPRNDPADFDLLVAASPVWAGRVSTPMRAYLRAVGGRAPRLALLATAATAAPHSAFRDMERSACATPLATLTLSGREAEAPEEADALGAFAVSLRESLPALA